MLEQFDAFLEGNLTDPLAFQAQLDKDESLRKQFDQYQEFVLGIEQAVLSNKLNHFHENMEQNAENKPPKKIFQLPMMRYLAAACIGLLVISIGWILSNQNASEYQQLFTDHFEADKGLPTLMGDRPPSGDDYTFDFNKAMVDYKFGRYDDAIEAWAFLLEDHPNSDTIQYFLGLSHLAKGDAPEAANYLESVTKMESSAFFEEAHWYYGLTLIKLGEIKAAKESLKRSKRDGKKVLLDRLNE